MEDLISTAGSCIEVVEALGRPVPRCWAWCPSSPTACRRAWTAWRPPMSPTTPLSNFDAVCEVAAEEGKIRPEDIARLKQFRANPSDESWITSK